jgi:hypothetical protein
MTFTGSFLSEALDAAADLSAEAAPEDAAGVSVLPHAAVSKSEQAASVVTKLRSFNDFILFSPLAIV